MFVEASVVIAILTGEAGAERLAAVLDAQGGQPAIISVLAVWEATVGLYRKKRIPMAEAEARVREPLTTAGIEVMPVGDDQTAAALQVFERYGRHRYPDSERNSALNLAQCFHYAMAKSHRLPILTKDAGLALTDVATSGPDS